MFSEADDFEFDEPRASEPGKILPFPHRAAPDWLTGPDDGLGAVADPHDDTTDEAPPGTLPQPVLRRPGIPEPVSPPGLVVSPTFAAPSEVLPQPVLRRPGVPEPVSPPGLAAKAEPEVESAETGKASEIGSALEAGTASEAKVVAAPARPRRTAPPGIWAPVASSVPSLRLVLPAEPEPVEDGPVPPAPARFHGLPGRDEDPPRVVAVPPPAPPPLVALSEPWWVVALDGLRTSRSMQIWVAVAFVVLVLLAGWLWPRGAGTTSLSELRRYPARFDGRAVVVRGRVGDDVFAVGAGWAFYLVQGRDTIVTFTRSQMPKPHDVATVKGQVSTGFLDGVPRQALFEDTALAK